MLALLWCILHVACQLLSLVRHITSLFKTKTGSLHMNIILEIGIKNLHIYKRNLRIHIINRGGGQKCFVGTYCHFIDLISLIRIIQFYIIYSTRTAIWVFQLSLEAYYTVMTYQTIRNVNCRIVILKAKKMFRMGVSLYIVKPKTNFFLTIGKLTSAFAILRTQKLLRYLADLRLAQTRSNNWFKYDKKLWFNMAIQQNLNCPWAA